MKPFGSRLDSRQNLVLALILFSTGALLPLHATDRFFANLRQASPNGRFVAQAVSPDNAGGKVTRPFSAGFVYQLDDAQRGTRLWTWPSAKDESGRPEVAAMGPPTALFVSEDGWVVIRTADVHGAPIQLVTISPEGKRTVCLDLMDALHDPNDPRIYAHTGMSSAGLRWGPGYSHNGFLTLEGRPYFSLRAWWDKRLLVDLALGQVVPVSPKAAEQLEAEEKAQVLRVLKGAQAWRWQTNSDGIPALLEAPGQPSVWEALSAIHLAGRARILDARPFLRPLEECPFIGSTTGSSGDYTPGSDGINPYVFQNLEVRQMVKLALLRLEAQPSGYQSTKLLRNGDRYWFPEDPHKGDRAEQALKVQPGMRPDKVVEILGAPDFIDGQVWAYDLPGPAPCTFRIAWTAEGVGQTTRQTPPAWLTDERDRMLVL